MPKRAAALAKCAKLAAFVVGAGVLGFVENSKGCLRPDGWPIDLYHNAGAALTYENQVASRATNQTILLSFRIYVTYQGVISHRDTSATLIDGENAITTTDNILDLLAYSPAYEVATGPNWQTNRGTVITVDRVTYDTNNLDSDPIAVLHLASYLPNVNTRIASNIPAANAIISQAGFDYSGTPSGGTAGEVLDGSSSCWQATTVNDTLGGFSYPAYFSSLFNPYIPQNGQGLSLASGGEVFNSQNQLLGVNYAAAPGTPEAGFTTMVNITPSNPSIYNFIIGSLIHSQPTVSITSTGSEEVAVSVGGETNQIYCVQRSLDLMTWTNLITLTNLTGSVTYIDSDATNHAAGFYQAVVK